MRLLLHACCGPCLIEPLAGLRREHDITVYFANPNIQPLDEFGRRRSTLREYAVLSGVPVIDSAYEPERWLSAVGSLADRPERCRACYEVRFGMTARAAAEHGFEAFATTLTVSPYQDAQAIREVAEAVATDVGVRYVHGDFRDRYRDAQDRARELGMYRQNYCGCLLSKAESDAERAARKAERAARKAEREAAGVWREGGKVDS